MVETVEEGRFELNFYGALAWARSRARAYTRDLWNFLRCLRPDIHYSDRDFSVAAAGGFPSYVGGSVDRYIESIAGRKVSLQLLIYSRGMLSSIVSKRKRFIRSLYRIHYFEVNDNLNECEARGGTPSNYFRSLYRKGNPFNPEQLFKVSRTIAEQKNSSL